MSICDNIEKTVATALQQAEAMRQSILKKAFENEDLDKKEDFNIFVDSLWNAYNTMRTRAPMTDWYYADTSHMRGFRNRTVQGGLFIKLMF